MKYSVVANWADSLEIMTKRPFVMIPFLIAGFLEAVALELIYFSSGEPLGHIMNPIIKKFFGEAFAHFPGNLLIVPKLFFFAQVMITAVIGMFLTALTIYMADQVIKRKAINIKDALKKLSRRYVSIFIYAVLVIALGYFLKIIANIALHSIIRPMVSFLPRMIMKSMTFWLSSAIFLIMVCVNTFFILTIPILVVNGSSMARCIGESIFRGGRNYITLCKTVCTPFLLYIPIIFLKAFSTQLVRRTLPVSVLIVGIAGIFVIKYIECFVAISATRFLLDTQKIKRRKRKGASK
ncbi:MAG: hypothetical protein ABID09_02665 [Candidatus Omnitrophota bacterium]